MITRLNLASHPFRNRTLPYLIALLLLSFSVAGAVLCFASLRDLKERDKLARTEITAMETELKELNSKGEQVQQQLTPQQKELLVGAHKLVANKSFGWSRLFSDLESILPGGVSASRISVENVYRDGEQVKAELDFIVLSRDYRSVMSMIESMNATGHFRAELRGQNLQKSERGSFTEYTLYLIYSPRAGVSFSSQSDVAQSQEGNQ